MLLLRRLAYSVGHLQNDLCAAVWFSYYLVYLQQVAGLSHSVAGYILFWGQLVDAMATPIVGVYSDKSRGFPRYGKRKSWHLVGSFIVSLAFPFLHIQCYKCHVSDHSNVYEFIYYVTFVAAFQVGWATVQVSHLALIPEICGDEGEKMELNSVRYAWTVVANIIVYLTTWLLLGIDSTKAPMVTPQDQRVFFTLAASVIGLGFLFTIIFHVGTREPPTPRENDTSAPYSSIPSETISSNNPNETTPDLNNQGEYPDDQRSPNNETDTLSLVTDSAKVYSDISPPDGISVAEPRREKWYQWLKFPQFYQVCSLYSCARVMVNITQVYMPLYVMNSARLEKSYIAAIPLLTYLSGLTASLFMKWCSMRVGTKWLSFIGGIGALVSSIFFYFPGSNWTIICGFIILGCSSTTATISALALTTNIIGQWTENGAFVFGCASFADKLLNGLVVVTLQQIYPSKASFDSRIFIDFFKWIMVLVPAVSASIYLLILATLAKSDLGNIPLGSVIHEENGDYKPLLMATENNEDQPLTSGDTHERATKRLQLSPRKFSRWLRCTMFHGQKHSHL